MSQQRAGLLHRGDLDELVRAIDAAASRDDWDEVEALRMGCVEALERTGRQLWGPAAYAAYRLALDAPVRMAVAALLAGHDRHTLGPLTEVIAQRHAWDDLVGMLPGGPMNAVVAVERVARGEDLSDEPRAELFHLDVPGAWQPWEGRPPVATYRPDEVIAPAPDFVGQADWIEVRGGSGRPRRAQRLETAIHDLVAPWADASNGRVDVAAVDAGPDAAVAALVAGAAWRRRLPLAAAVERMTWAGASGGARARRRGLAAGRSATWWALRLVVADELVDGDDPDELEFCLEECTFHEFTDGDDEGWRLRLAIGHPDGWAVAVDAHDHSDDDSGDDGELPGAPVAVRTDVRS